VVSLRIARKEGLRSWCRQAWEKIKRREFRIIEPSTAPLLERKVIKGIHAPHQSNISTADLLMPDEKKITPYEDATVSVVIPSKNAGRSFETLLLMFKRQEGLRNIEIIVVDSGSLDNTLEISKKYGAKIIEIPPEKFSHSYSRNVGAENATGRYIFFTVQDALPPSELFLYELFSVLKNNNVVAVSCREIPREDADLFYRVISWNHYRFLEVDKGDKIFSLPEKENYITLRKNGQLSDIALLISKDVFMKYRYRGDYAEDLDLGIRLIRNGYKIAFLNSIGIIHSHNRPAYYFLKRGYVDSIFLSKMFPDLPVPSLQVDDFMKNIIFTFNAIDSLSKEISTIKMPCDVEEFIRKLKSVLKMIFNPERPCPIKIAKNQYIDEDFWSFLEETFDQCSIKQNIVPRNNILANAILSFLEIVFSYMKESYEVIDDYILDDFKTCIFKGYALSCGVHLAYCYLSNPDDKRLKEIHEKLSEGI